MGIFTDSCLDVVVDKDELIRFWG